VKFQDKILNETLSSLDFLLSFIRKTQAILFELRAQMNSTTIVLNTVELPVKFYDELSDETSEIKIFCVKKNKLYQLLRNSFKLFSFSRDNFRHELCH
jgi:hypothetical protein